MKFAEAFPHLVPASNLPPGGSPAGDTAYETWLRTFVDTANLRWLDRHWPDVPDGDLMKTYQLTHHLYKWLIGCEFPRGSGPNYLHRLRFVAVQYALRPQQIETEAWRYAAELIEKHTMPQDDL